jgi:hypothetical protein
VPLAEEAEAADAGDAREGERKTVRETSGGDDAGRYVAAGKTVEAADTSGGAGAPVAQPAGARAGTEAEAETQAHPVPVRRRHKLVVSARRTAYITLSTGGRNLHDDLFAGGQVDSFFSETPFVINFLTDRGAWTFVQDGERVRLPGSSSEDVSNFEIPLPSGD